MGSLCKARCLCGYESGPLYLGGGMIDFRTYFGVPAYCSKCNSVEVVNLLDKRPLCRNCGSSVTLYNDQSLKKSKEINEEIVFEWNHRNKNFRLYSGNYYCPSCHKYNMKFKDMGNWD